MGRKGLWLVCVFRLLPDTPTFEPAVSYEKEDGLIMKRTTLLVTVGATVLALLAVVVGAALANTPSGVTATPVTAIQITRATLGKFEAENKGVEVQSGRRSADLAIVKVVIEPGGSTGWHHHPGVALVPVKAGSVTEYDAQCHKEVHLVRNEGDVKAVLYATFLVPTATPPEGLTISDPQPKECHKQ
jgi:quercetin dioxygenase-like cupin family protein